MAYATGFNAASCYDAANSVNVYPDPRGLMCPLRAQATTYMQEPFDSLGIAPNNWTPNTPGSPYTNTQSIVGVGNQDPAVSGNALQLATGSYLGSTAFVQKTGITLPAKFGLMFMIKIPAVGSDPADFFEFKLQKSITNQKSITVRYNGNGFYVQMDTGGGLAWQLLTSCANLTGWMEGYLEVNEVNGQDVISIYLGTENKGTLTGTFPDHVYQHSGLTYLGLCSGANAYRSALVAQLNIGVTQLPNDMDLRLPGYTLQYQAGGVKFELLVEDVCNSIDLSNTDLAKRDLQLEISTGGPFNPFPLTYEEDYCNGVIDSTKKVRRYTAQASTGLPWAQNTVITPKIKTRNGKYIAPAGYRCQPTSTM